MAKQMDAINAWGDWAARDAVRMTNEEWSQLVDGWADIEVEDMRDELAGLSDGALVRLMRATTDNPTQETVVRDELARLRRATLAEARRRVWGAQADEQGGDRG